MALGNNYLTKARKEKNDEFYTQYSDIEEELSKFQSELTGKIVYCPCDNQRSKFPQYFKDNFDKLKLKGLYTSAINGKAYFYDGKRTDLNMDNIDILGPRYLDLLSRCDIVVTNPPFSLFRQFLNTIIDNKKDFIIVGQQNTITCKDVFQHIMDGNLYLDYGFKGIAGYFDVPKRYEDTASAGEHIDGKIRVSGVIWYTSFNKCVERPFIQLKKSINDMTYTTFKNFKEISGLTEDCINVDKVKDIPNDYYGFMGVPISFFGKYNPNQFELIQLDHYPNTNSRYNLGNQDNVIVVDGKDKQTYRRIYVKLKK